ncbi:MAG: hypothetical protein SV760_06865 [Halobacteria archaeon]|nr:hypothetical protein [Halobacteria archaeon]
MEPVRYGNTGLMAYLVYENFELCLMLIAGFVLGGVMVPIIAASAGVQPALVLASITSIGIGWTIIAGEITFGLFEGDAKGYEL